MTDTLKQEERWRDSLKLRLPPAARKLATAKDAGDMGGIGALILRFRLSIGLLLVAITLFMAYGVSKVKFATSFVDFFPAGNPNTVLYEKYRQDFGGAQSLVIAIRVKKGDIFNFATLKKVQEINRRGGRAVGCRSRFSSIAGFLSGRLRRARSGRPHREAIYVSEHPEERGRTGEPKKDGAGSQGRPDVAR